jgi:PAS domain S-box-containing protein
MNSIAAKGVLPCSVPAWVQDYALFMLDADQNIVAWYGGAERIYGYTSAQVVGQPLSLLLPAVDILHAKGLSKNNLVSLMDRGAGFRSSNRHETCRGGSSPGQVLRQKL